MASGTLMPFRHRNLAWFQFRWISACVFLATNRSGDVFNSCTTVDLAGGQLPWGWWSSSQRVEVLLWWTFIHLFTAWQMCWQKHYSYLFHVNAMIKKSGVMCSWVCIVYVECWTHWNLLAWVETLHNSNKTVMGFWFWSTSINSCFWTLNYGSWTFITWRKSLHMEVINALFFPKERNPTTAL